LFIFERQFKKEEEVREPTYATTVYALQTDTILACTEAGGAVAELTPTQYASHSQREPQVGPIAG
jgi:hypothetical protein